MEPSTDFVALATALGTAFYAALCLDFLAIDELGLSLQLVWGGAVSAALLVGVFIAIEFLSGKLSKDR